ncbi:ethanolamine ammonia-lyase subunit EutC [Mangrovicella endophytica]|uniref:ethanolamine ammonia-lyase subunit EutC n=1 Tax=Mangrovicella endophytica TaxID=2066697 RepID=UPI000C9E7305|nr:ethanolamine ammonia-lyase subunit EutC [Mangrovicella endophytica]
MADNPLRPPVPAHPLRALRRFTDARIGLGRQGAGLPTAAHLDFAEAHARARDAVHAPFDAAGIAEVLQAQGIATLTVDSEAGDRATYLRRPDLGRRLASGSATTLQAGASGESCDLALIIADGLSAYAVNLYAADLAAAILRLVPQSWRVAPVVLASHARVALSDPVGAALGARIALMLIGERPGLSAADSLGAYLTFDPKPGRSDANRNCVSNIRSGGLTPELAAVKIAGLLKRSASLGLSGTALKDDEGLIEGEPASNPLLGRPPS